MGGMQLTDVCVQVAVYQLTTQLAKVLTVEVKALKEGNGDFSKILLAYSLLPSTQQFCCTCMHDEFGCRPCLDTLSQLSHVCTLGCLVSAYDLLA